MAALRTRPYARPRGAFAGAIRLTLIVALLAPALLLMPGAALATSPPDGVTGIDATCALDGTSNLTDLQHDGPISFHSDSVDGQASAGTLGAAASPGPGDECEIESTFEHHVRIDAGTSGLQFGDPVTLTVTVGLDGVISTGLQGESGTVVPSLYPASSLEGMEASYSIKEPVCVEICATYVEFGTRALAEFEQDISVGPEDFWSSNWWWELTTNLGADLYDEWSDELGPGVHVCPDHACPDTDIAIAPDAVTFQAAIGDELLVTASLDVSARLEEAGDGAADFFDTLGSTRVEPAAGFEGVAVLYDGETVGDVDSPTLTTPGPLVAEATGPDGANVTYAVTATDTSDPAPLVDCVDADTNAPVSATGGLFPLGVTNVSCVASDAAFNVSEPQSFTVTVVDTTPPTLTIPADISIGAAGPDGAVVNYDATASDLVDPTPLVMCDPASGSTFAFGATSVSCVATDASGNGSAAQVFTVTVNGADSAAQLQDLQSYVAGLDIRRGAKTTLLVTIAVARVAVAFERTQLACFTLNVLVNEAHNMSGRQLTSEQADAIVVAATSILATLDC